MTLAFPCFPGDSESDDWPMETEDKGLKMEPLLQEAPVLLPTLSLSLAPEGPADSPTLALTAAHSQPAQVKVITAEGRGQLATC